jgi:uncharacterized protein involved in response to NO
MYVLGLVGIDKETFAQRYEWLIDVRHDHHLRLLQCGLMFIALAFIACGLIETTYAKIVEMHILVVGHDTNPRSLG